MIAFVWPSVGITVAACTGFVVGAVLTCIVLAWMTRL
jgi:hypothetical protein